VVVIWPSVCGYLRFEDLDQGLTTVRKGSGGGGGWCS